MALEKWDLGHWDWNLVTGNGKKCQKWEWDKYFVTMKSQDHLFPGVEKSQKSVQAPDAWQFWHVYPASGTVSAISGSASTGDSDGTAPKLCQPLGICVEFDHNVYLTDMVSGSVKLIKRPTKGMVKFLQNLQTLVRAFDSHSRKKNHLQDLIIPMTKESRWLKICHTYNHAHRKLR